MRTSEFVDFIKQREAHRIAKERSWSITKRKPDPII
jgi:accessory colonization factor AcfC